jgi:hypothetical protein
MVRSIIAGTAVAGALTVGVAGGIAGAATTGSGTSGGTPSAAACARVPKVEARVHAWEGKIAQRLPKAEAREAKAKAAGHTKLANFIAKRVERVQAREAKVNARLSKIEAKCGTASSSSAAS